MSIVKCSACEWREINDGIPLAICPVCQNPTSVHAPPASWVPVKPGSRLKSLAVLKDQGKTYRVRLRSSCGRTAVVPPYKGVGESVARVMEQQIKRDIKLQGFKSVFDKLIESGAEVGKKSEWY